MYELKSVLIVIPFCLVMGCASAGGPVFSGLQRPKEGEGLLYVYRPSQFKNGGIYPMVLVDNKEIGYLRNGGYMLMDIAPGEHVVGLKNSGWTWDPGKRWDFDTDPVKVSGVAGEVLFVCLSTEARLSWLFLAPIPGGGLISAAGATRSAYLGQVARSNAVVELRTLRLSD